MRYEPLPAETNGSPVAGPGPDTTAPADVAAQPSVHPTGRPATRLHPADAPPRPGAPHRPTSAGILHGRVHDRHQRCADDRLADDRPRHNADDCIRQNTDDRVPHGPDDRLRQSAGSILRLLLEVLDGRRPLVQLAPYLAPSVLRYVRAAGRTGGGPSRLTSVRVCRLRASAAEVAAVYRANGRARAVAIRLEQPRDAPGTWRCTAIRLG